MIRNQVSLSALLLLSGSYFAYESLRMEIRTGEPAIRGLVHSAVVLFFTVLLWNDGHFAGAFATGASALLWTTSIQSIQSIPYPSSLLLLLLFSIAQEEYRMRATGLLFLVASSSSLSGVEGGMFEILAGVFHRSFVYALSSHRSVGSNALFSVCCLAFSICEGLEGDTGGMILYAICVPPWWWTWERREGEPTCPRNGPPLYYVRNGKACIACLSVYVFFLTYDAWRSSRDCIVSQTRYVHVAAMAGAMLSFSKFCLQRKPLLTKGVVCLAALTEPVLLFMKDGLESEAEFVSVGRCVGSLLVAGSFLFCRSEPDVILSDDLSIPPPSFQIRTAHLLLYAYIAAHVAYASLSDTFEHSVWIVFHSIAVTAGFSYWAIVWRRNTQVWLAASFLSFEMVSSVLCTSCGLWWRIGLGGSSAALLASIYVLGATDDPFHF